MILHGDASRTTLATLSLTKRAEDSRLGSLLEDTILRDERVSSYSRAFIRGKSTASPHR